MTDSAAHRSPDRWIQATVAQPTDEGWTALTDGGIEISVPRASVTGFRALRCGQRVRVRPDDGDAATAAEAAPVS